MCLYPQLVKNPKYKPNKKNGYQEVRPADPRVLYVPVGCGQCIECRRKKTREWQVRLLEDVKKQKNGHFVTLTFSDDSYSELAKDEKVNKLSGYELDNGIAKLAIRRFLERWRKKHKKSIRHWLVTELGHKGTENIHLHGILWTDESVAEIRKHWQYGMIWAGYDNQRTYVNQCTVNYMTKYINKIDFTHKYYKAVILSSAGIGRAYMERTDWEKCKYQDENTKEYYRTSTGHEMALPIYWRNKIYSDDEREKLWIQKLEKNERWICGQKVDISENQNAYFKLLKYHQKRNEILGYGNNKIDWTIKKYEEQRRTLLQNQRKNELIKEKEFEIEIIEREQKPHEKGIKPSTWW